MQEYTSCHWLQHGLSFENDHIEMCCLCCHKGGGRLNIKDYYDGKNVSWDDIFASKEKFIEENKNNLVDKRCEGCFNLVYRGWDDSEKYINYIHFNHWTHCNSDCIYCYTSWDKENYQKRPHYNVLPMIKDLFKKKLFRPGGEITFAGGEPTILKEFDELTTFLIKNGADRITVHSSGIKFSKAIEKGIKEGVLHVCLSADSGTRETYNKVKRVDKFDKFWENAKKYAKAQKDFSKALVETKFVLIPEINTTKEEIDKWLELNVKNGIKFVVVDIENDYCRDLRAKNIEKPKYLIDLCAYIIERTKELGLQLIDYNNFRYLTEEYNLI
ncbi:radical SAM protein [bacterium]|nr:radical SAM protein [bacterium]